LTCCRFFVAAKFELDGPDCSPLILLRLRTPLASAEDEEIVLEEISEQVLSFCLISRHCKFG
jgi:hypothetical protein